LFVKICGITSEEDALLAVAMGADAVGFTFAPSPRQIAPGRVADIVKRLPPEILTIGNFRDEAAERVVDIVGHVGLKGAQLHGHESAVVTQWVAERVGFTIKAFAAGDPDIAKGASYGARAILIDAPSPGSGQVFDWKLADGAPPGVPLLLAGGLDSTNVAEAIAAVRPWGVDVASGVESAPGKKDARKLHAFIAAAKAASPNGAGSEGDDGDATDADGGPYDWRLDR
jgi:phosphoribosylanthranilate isomerase